FSPLPAISVAKLSGLSNQGSVNNIIGSLRSILQVLEGESNSGNIRLLHPSFRDFFVDKNRENEEYWVDECKAHEALFLQCIDVMSTALKEDICDLRFPDSSVVELDVLEKVLPAEVRYACRYWILHLQKSGLALCDYDKTHTFLETHFLHWLEALSLLRLTPEGIRAVKLL